MNLHNAKALSVSCGDGIWDYLSLSWHTGVSAITATDVVECPVKSGDVELLRSLGEWSFQQVVPGAVLPFSSDSFDVAFPKM